MRKPTIWEAEEMLFVLEQVWRTLLLGNNGDHLPNANECRAAVRIIINGAQAEISKAPEAAGALGISEIVRVRAALRLAEETVELVHYSLGRMLDELREQDQVLGRMGAARLLGKTLEAYEAENPPTVPCEVADKGVIE